ncbi:ERG4/ERG24 ergosterol biosynthesis protein [Myriangium duriaei CBS 260.36]|uniref:Delta(14)-sterol reductase n=1 Tax=Myriangium duriaei CBS 260.36 TaxID=1168546 RepID=A0A9P4IW66_9PEZI|nr:ERG4/ERG24 ergosterol biosynthesis protein [Myriangium duriaei CBS 260.36]
MAKPGKQHAPNYEFFGPPGATLISFGLPIVCYLFAFFVNDVSGCPPPSLLQPSTFTLEKLKQDVGWQGFGTLLNTQTAFWTIMYYALNVVLWKVLPGQEVEGTVLRNGSRIKYRFNGFLTATFILSVLAAGTAVEGPDFPVWTFINNNYVPLLTMNILISYGLATFVYIRSFTVQQPKDPKNRELAEGGATGNLIYDWFIGRELNPTVRLPVIGDVDIKSFCEVRPGLLGWIILDLAFMMRQWKTYGYITDSMYVCCLTQAVYMLDSVYVESAIMTQMDITTDGFGFMLAFGDLAWVPFTYSIQARYLSIHPVQLGWYGVAAIMTIQISGYLIFRLSNLQKNTFRTNPDDPAVSHLSYIQTQTGSRLITSGWWGTARHINYFGDWLMSWAYCLPTLFSGYVIHRSHITGNAQVDQGTDGEFAGWATPITYFYMLYFAVLLIHRQLRDDEKCHKKYGKDWEEYCRQVKWRIIPGIY